MADRVVGRVADRTSEVDFCGTGSARTDRAQGLPDYLEVLSKSVFQPGMSWRVVEAKRPGIKEAFEDWCISRGRTPHTPG